MEISWGVVGFSRRWLRGTVGSLCLEMLYVRLAMRAQIYHTRT